MRWKQVLHMTRVVVVASLSSATAAHAESVLTGTVLAAETKEPVQDKESVQDKEPVQDVVTDARGQFRIPALPPGVYPIDQDFTQRIAVNRPPEGGAARSFEALAEFVPGTQREVEGFSIHGATPLENGYVVDGLSTQDPVSGFNASPLSVEFLQEFEVITSGYMPQYGRATGGILRARTRSGSNEFHGSVYSTVTPGLLEGTRAQVQGAQEVVSSQNSLNVMGDVGATLGGPLVKDKLWFFAGVAPSLTRHQHTRTLNRLMPGEDGVYVPTPIPGTSRTYFLGQRGFQAMGKLTYLFNQDHNVSLSVITTPTHSGFEGRPTGTGSTSVAGWIVTDRNFTTSSFHYAGAFLDKRLLVDAHLGWSRQTEVNQLVTNSNDPPPACVPDKDGEPPTCIFYSSGGAGGPNTNRYQSNLQATWLLDLAGAHVFRAGVDGEFLAFTENYWGSVIIREAQADPYYKHRYTSNLLGGFVQDSWTLFDRVTVNGGVRYDTQWLYRDDGRLAFALRDQLSPRVGLVVDPMAQGRMKLFAHYAKYRGQMQFDLMKWGFPRERPYMLNQTRADRAEPVDPAIAPPSSTELVAGAEYEVFAMARLSAHYTHRGLDSAIKYMSRDDGRSYFLGNPGLGLASDLPKAERTYDAVTVALSRTFRDGWLAQASYTWSRLYGNHVGGPVGGETAFASGFETPSLMVNRSGPLPYDRTHSLKLFGAREFHLTGELSASIGLSYLGCSGTPINYLGAHELLGAGEAFILPRGSSGERTPWVHVIDSNVGVNYRLGGDKVVSFTLDVFNLFNFQQVTRVDEIYTSVTVLPVKNGRPGDLPGAVLHAADGKPLTESELNRNFKRPLQYQAPREMRLGLRYAF
jgi:hypothetical protein